MTRLRRLIYLALGCAWLAAGLAELLLEPPFTGLDRVAALSANCVTLGCGIFFLGLALAPWGDEPR
jgi:hypothetical protein